MELKADDDQTSGRTKKHLNWRASSTRGNGKEGFRMGRSPVFAGCWRKALKARMTYSKSNKNCIKNSGKGHWQNRFCSNVDQKEEPGTTAEKGRG